MKRSVFMFWLYSNLLILLIPIAIAMVVLFQSQSMLFDEVEKSNTTLLGQIQQSIDNQVKDIRRLGLQISLDPKLLKFIYTGDSLSTEARLNARDLIELLHSYATSNGTIADLYVYRKDAELGITSTTLNQADILYSQQHSGIGLSYNDWKSLMKEIYPGNFININRNPDVNASSLVFIQSLPVQDLYNAPVTLVVQLNQDRFKKAIKGVNPANMQQLYIFNHKGELVMSTGKSDEWKELNFANISGNEGGFKQKIKGEDVSVSYLTSDETDWTYVVSVPTSLYSAKVAKLNRLMIAGLLLCIGLGGFMAYWLTRRNYRPIRNLVDLVSNQVKDNLKTANDEYSILRSFMRESAADRDEANRTIQSQQQALRNHFLARLLKGRIETGSALALAFESYDMQFETDRFAALLFHIGDFQRLFRINEKVDIEKKLELVYLIVTNIVGELVNRKHKAYFTEIDGMVACLVGIGSSHQDAKKDLIEAAEAAQKFIKDKFLIGLSVGISDIHLFLEGIPRCYDEAVQALEHKLIIGSDQIIPYDLIKQPKNELYYPLETERQLINFIASGDYEGATQVISRIIGVNVSDGTLSVKLGKLLMFEVIGTMLKAVEQIQLSSKELAIEKSEVIGILTECETIAEMENKIYVFLQMVCDYISSKKKSHNTELIDRIVSYIQGNLEDYNISLTSVSLRFEVNSSYLSKFFKEQTGENFVDFINKQRVEQSKQLLKEFDMTVNDIGVKVGFTNSNTFIRAFKRYEGITPGQYRQNEFIPKGSIS
ncbi:helix-turn-helix domain-containing protein [Paenibacillus qinlingensis]|uniref:helix-turn-helix domain-containing protein n=1 Tax=Paenibacillus qinlingensis TaxID=1837343 RepID=UPI001563EFF0|nr:helix-turn-helix domain-containing protein [Paenibacillus qinlingensis]NQX63333.1 AraC family transcriptional regulator [Paenibacillus qinlingensis]